MKEKILEKLNQIDEEKIKEFLIDNGVSSWKLAFASRQQMIDGIKEEMEKYSEKQLTEFYNKYLK